MTDSQQSGASETAIRAHYDVSNEFYRLWLDETMTYSCAMWDISATLEEAQLRKLDFHIDQARAESVGRVLDIGCGWGSLMRRLSDRGAREVVGLTLSTAQADYIRNLGISGASVAVQDWRDHSVDSPYDSLISVGAMEHFVRPELSTPERVGVYRDFFASCKSWLRSGQWMSLQTSTYGEGQFTHGAISSIFPESDLPRLNEILQAIAGQFELVSLRNDRSDYSRTCRAWLDRLRSKRALAVELVGEQTVAHYESFLAASSRGLDAGVFNLLRMQLRRIGA
jgi:cyclopropane-fatty-acyl-phospholipid synthase